MPERLRGETASFEIKAGDKVMVEKGTPHHRTPRARARGAGIKKLAVPTDYLVGKILAHDVVDTEPASCSRRPTRARPPRCCEKLFEAGIDEIQHALRERPRPRPVHLGHAAHRPDQEAPGSAVEIYRMMRPGEPPTRSGREPVPEPVLQPRALRPLGRRPHEVQPPCRPRGDSKGPAACSTKDDIIEVLNTLIDIRNGNGDVDDIDHLGNRRVRCVGEMAENAFRVGLVRVERAVKERLTLAESEGLMPQEMINAKPVAAAMKEFFGSSQLSQFMDQNNPLSEVTHKRRVSALGPGGLRASVRASRSATCTRRTMAGSARSRRRKVRTSA